MILSKKMSYLCIMKNENEMDTILTTNGFKPTENPNEYVRDTWIIRIDGDFLEAFNTLPEEEELQIYARVSKERFFDLLDDINII